MEISKAIRQGKFNSSQEKALINLLYTHNWLRDAQNKILKKYNILPQHYNVLRIVNGQHPNPVSTGYILDVMLDKGRDLTRLVDKLVTLKMLNKEFCKHNRRKTDISITQKGIDISNEIRSKLYEWMDEENHLTEEESEQLSYLLDKMRG